MRSVILALVILTLAMALYLPLSPETQAANISSLEPSHGPVGQTVQLEGSVTCGNNYQVYWDSSDQPANLLTQGKSGAGCTIFIEIKIPEAVKGKHRIILRDVEEGTEVFQYFTIIPAINASALSGTTGTTINITGTGFGANEANITITYDGATAKGDITADAKGRWNTTLVIPESPRGKHSIQVSGAVTTAAEVSPIVFTVAPRFSVEPTQGGIGMVLTATGTGFGAEEKDIKITFDGLPIKTGVAADTNGSFRTSFATPTAVKGEHIIDASGTVTTAAEVPNLTFTVGPSLLIQPTAGHVGDQVTVIGSGFAVNETDITATYDNSQVVSNTTADANGAWVATFTIPASSAGKHLIAAAGAVTSAQTVVSPSFIVLPQLVLNPTSGEVGTTVVATGTGFGKSQPVAIAYDDIKLALDVATDPNGSFTATFKAPATFGKQHEVSVKDNTGNQVVASFTTEAIPPPNPSPISPTANAKIGFVGKQIVTFEWSGVTDPSGVSYVLEIGSQADFQNPILRYKDLIKTEYTLTKVEALDYGKYYWRVKAVDGAGNESDWTAAQPLAINRLKTSVFFIIIGIAAVLVFLILWRIITISRRGGWFEEY